LIVPSPRAILAASIAGAAAIAAIAWPPAALVLLAAAVGIAAAVIADGIGLRSTPLEAIRPDAATLALGEWQPIGVAIQNPGPWALAVEAAGDWPESFGVREPIVRARIAPGGTARLDWSVRPVRRGSYRLESIRIRIDRGRAAQVDRTLRAPQTVRVWPDTFEIVRCERRIRGPMGAGFGHRMTPVLGKGREFEKLRDHGPDDDYRDIHWKATARRHRLIVREYRIDRSQDIVIAIETGHRMAAPIGDLAKLDHAVNAALALAYAAHRNEDKVGLATFSSRIGHFVAAGRGRGHLARCSEILYGLEPDGHHVAWRSLVEEMRARIRRRSLIVIFTCLEEAESAAAIAGLVGMLRPRHIPLIVALRDPRLDALARTIPTDRRELALRIVASEERDARRAMLAALHARGALVLDSTPADLARGVVERYLDVKRRQML